jgi:hypothetical protein
MFASAEKESLEGDLFEEFSDLASRSGAAVAQRWYWRQALQSIVHLGIGAYRAAPYSTTAVVIAGFLLGRVLFRLVENEIFAVLERYRVFDTHFGLYVFLTSDGLAAAHVATSMLVGCFVAFVAKGKEMIATITLVLLLFGMTCAASWVWVARGNASMLWSMLPWIFLDWLAMLVGGAFIRIQRTASRKSSRT